MSVWTCPNCGAEDAVERVGDTAKCDECGATFEVENDGDCVDGTWCDCSTLGKEIATPERWEEGGPIFEGELSRGDMER